MIKKALFTLYLDVDDVSEWLLISTVDPEPVDTRPDVLQIFQCHVGRGRLAVHEVKRMQSSTSISRE